MTEISKYITIIRPEFMSFCKDACRSATLNHLLFRISGKCQHQPKEKIQAGEILWYAKTELITSEMSDAWGVCKVRKEVNSLIDMGLIGKTKDPEWGANRTKHFFFGSEQCEVFLKCCEENGVCVIHLDLPVEVKHLIYSSKANDRNIKCSCSEAEKAVANDKSIECKSYNHQMETIDLSDGNDTSIEAITKTTTKTSNKDNDKEERAYSAGESENATSVSAIASTAHTPSSQDEPYQPNYDLPQRESDNHSHIANDTPGGDGNGHHSNNTHSQSVNDDVDAAGRIPQRAPAVASQDVPTQAQLSTLSVGSPQASAKVAPKQGSASSQVVANRKRNIPAPTAQVKAQLTLLGGQVREWYEIIRATRLRMTANNVNAFNVLGDLDGMTFENLKETIETIDEQELVKSKNIPIGPQELASEEGYWRFDKWLPVVVRNRQRLASQSAPPKPTSPSLPSFSGMSDEEYYASLRGGNNNARAAYAR